MNARVCVKKKLTHASIIHSNIYVYIYIHINFDTGIQTQNSVYFAIKPTRFVTLFYTFCYVTLRVASQNVA